MKTKLDERIARTDLTDRECSKILGGLLGSLSLMTDEATLMRAITWWAEHPEAIHAQYQSHGEMQNMVLRQVQRFMEGKDS